MVVLIDDKINFSVLEKLMFVIFFKGSISFKQTMLFFYRSGVQQGKGPLTSLFASNR